MDFSKQYLTYEEYRGLGGTIDLMPFNLLEFEVRKKIDLRTKNRLKNLDSQNIPDEVKLCEFKMINSLVSYNEKTKKINDNSFKSESTDGYSVTFSGEDEIKNILEVQEKEFDNIMLECLYGVIVNNTFIP